MPSAPSNTGEGLRQRRAAQLRAEMEAARQEQSVNQPQTEGTTGSEAAAAQSPASDQQEQYQGTGPVGQGEYAARQGECISSIAKDTGHFWETIWNDPANAELREVRQNPNVLLPGDCVHVPQLRQKQETGQTEMRHRFIRRGEPARLRLIIKRRGGVRQTDRALRDRESSTLRWPEEVDQAFAPEPCANEPYVLEIDGRTIDGFTAPDGALEVPISGGERRGRLLVGTEPDVLEFQLSLGQLDPVETVRGVQQRLNNLGYACGPVDGIIGRVTRAALRQFQQECGLAATGRCDDTTRSKLLERHGC